MHDAFHIVSSASSLATVGLYWIFLFPPAQKELHFFWLLLHSFLFLFDLYPHGRRHNIMKVKTLKRSIGSVERECIGDARRTTRNLEATAHPMQRAREYTRAVTASKMDRMFAKPFVGSLGNGHMDAVLCTATSRRSLVPLLSGAADGSVKLWDLQTRTSMVEIPHAHSRIVNDVVFDSSGRYFFSCGDDGKMHQWAIHPTKDDKDGSIKPISTWAAQEGAFKSLDHHWISDTFVTASDSAVQVWTPHRSTALQTHADLWGSTDTVHVVRCHPSEHALLANCSMDRGIGLHDTRTGSALQKTVLQMRSNDLQWNPMEPMNFVVANEDYNAYTFDMRKLSEPTRIYKGHVGAVMSVSWSPTGREFVTGSYDRTIRIFKCNQGTSRDIYHTKRMQRVFTVNYTMDDQFIISGSDETNIRIWKAHASKKLGQLSTREEKSMNYQQALIRRHSHLPEVKQIVRSRKIPRTIQKQTAQAHVQKESQDRKHANRVKYSKDGTHKFIPERQKIVVKKVD